MLSCHTYSVTVRDKNSICLRCGYKLKNTPYAVRPNWMHNTNHSLHSGPSDNHVIDTCYICGTHHMPH